MKAYMMEPSHLEDFATRAGFQMLDWLIDNGYITEDDEHQLRSQRPVILYKSLPWYSKWWKKLWPSCNEEDHMMVVVRLPDFATLPYRIVRTLYLSHWSAST